MKTYTSTQTVGVILLISLLFFAGCISRTNPPTNTPPENIPPVGTTSSGWWAYAPVQANTNPWQTFGSTLNSDKSELEQVKAWLQGNHVNASVYGFIPHDEIVCDSLNCPRGDYLIIQPTDATSETFLNQNGFFSFVGVGVLVQESALQAGTQTITIVNALDENIYYGGCNEFVPEKITPNGNDPMPPKVCIWEGLPATLEAGDTTSFEWSALESGTYTIHFAYGTQCDASKPLSQQNCASTTDVYSQPFDVEGNSKPVFVKMQYEIKQCLSNPWQDMNAAVSPEVDMDNFGKWLNENGVYPQSIHYTPPVEGTIVCLACSCGKGDYYDIVVSTAQQPIATQLGLTYTGPYVLPLAPPAYDQAQWFVVTPKQCFANKWNVEKKPIHTVETDLQVLKDWLESKGVKVTYLTYLPGYTLGQQCLKLSTDRYGVGVTDDDSAAALQELGFSTAGASQLASFISVEDQSPLVLVYKSKFCTVPAWGTELSSGSEAAVSEKVAEWLAEQGMDVFAGPSIHTVEPSFSGACDTDSGLAVKVTVPVWTKPHLQADGFVIPSTTFNSQENQVYPPVSVDVNESTS